MVDRRDMRDRDRKVEPRPIAGRVPPHDLDAEAALLSACMLRGDAIDSVAAVVRCEDFYSDANGRIYEAIVEVHGQGHPADLVTVASWLRDRERLGAAGGPSYLAQIVDATPGVSDAQIAAYARAVRVLAKRRRLIVACQTIAAEGYGDVGDSTEWLEGAASAIETITAPETDERGSYLRDALAVAFRQIQSAAERGGVPGWTTGLRDLDRILGGLLPGGLTVVGARPGMGKSALAMGFADAVAGIEHDGELLGAAVFSLEMPREQLAKRLAFTRARVNPNPLKEGRGLDVDAWQALAEAARELSSIPLWIDDTPALSPMAIRAKARQIRADFKRRGVRLAVVVVDYLQLMNGKAGLPRNANREQEVAACSVALKALAKEIGVHVVALSQLNRSVESRADKHPLMSDLRESGAVEQDADNILLIYREDYYKPDTDQKGIAEVQVEKQRDGERGLVKVAFTDYCTRFDNLAPGWDADAGDVLGPAALS